MFGFTNGQRHVGIVRITEYSLFQRTHTFERIELQQREALVHQLQACYLIIEPLPDCVFQQIYPFPISEWQAFGVNNFENVFHSLTECGDVLT